MPFNNDPGPTVAAALNAYGNLNPKDAQTVCSALKVAFPETVHKRAAFDLGCPAEQVQVLDIGGSSYGATGCGKKASYTCVCMWHVWSDCTKVACTLDGATDPAAPPPPAGGAH